MGLVGLYNFKKIIMKINNQLSFNLESEDDLKVLFGEYVRFDYIEKQQIEGLTQIGSTIDIRPNLSVLRYILGNLTDIKVIRKEFLDELSDVIDKLIEIKETSIKNQKILDKYENKEDFLKH